MNNMLVDAGGQEIQIYSLSERAVTISFGNEISTSIAERISNFNTELHKRPFSGFKTTVSAYCTLTVFYEPMDVLESGLPDQSCFDQVASYLRSIQDGNCTERTAESGRIMIPVYYGGEFGPDLKEVSAYTNLSIDEVISLHSAAVYKVHMIGFVPGFAYLGGMDERLACMRKAQPRAAVPAGAIGIAGKQTGIYPLETPGGWQIIGQTPLRLFEVNRSSPSLLQAGDEIMFRPVSLNEFNTLWEN